MPNEDLIKEIVGDDEFEEKVQQYLRIAGEINRNKVLHKYVEIPIFESEHERSMWEDEEIRRCKEGHNGMTGKHYFYFNYCSIRGIKSGKRKPEWRRVDAEYFDYTERGMRGDLIGKGLINIKRRRIGASWKLVADIVHECTFYPFSDIGLQSKSDEDVKILFNDKLKFVYDNLPPFLKASSDAGNSLKKMVFAKNIRDDKGNRKKVGTQSSITCKAPGDTNWEGMGIKLWYADEAGKTENLTSIVSLTFPALCGDDGFTREGFPVLCGTVGDMDTVGGDIKYLWDKSEEYDLVRYFIPGWAGLNLDKYGNEDIEKNIRWILAERKKREGLSQKEYFDFVQQYPLTVEEAFMSGSECPFDLVSIHSRLAELDNNPYKWQLGFFKWDDSGKVYFQAARNKKEELVRILEHPQEGASYIAGCDPYDHDKKKNTGSQASMFIRKRFYEPTEEEDEKEGYMQQQFIFEYTDQPTNPNEYYEQALMACIYYDCKVLVERNRMRMIAYFTDNGYNEYLKTKPNKANKMARPTIASMTEYGVYMDEDTKRHSIGLTDDEIRNNPQCFTSKELLEDMKSYDPESQARKYDRVDACNITLLHARDIAMKEFRSTPATSVPTHTYKKRGGKMVRVSNK